MVVNKLRATDAVSLGTFNMQGGASGVVAFDGANIWVGNTYSLLKM
jgi:hypothetical protein